MPITYNTVAVDDVAHNSNVVQSVTYNGDEVWAAESRFALNVQSGTTVTFNFSQSSPNAISVNWGDGTEETFQPLAVRPSHTFSVASPTIIITCTDGETWSPGGGGATTGFAEGPAVVEAKLGKGVASLASYAFYGQPLESIVIPPGIQQLPDGTFSHCTYLESAVISNSTISIGGHAFYNCSRLTNVYIPPSIQSIGVSAFDGCTALTQVYIDDLGAWITTNFANNLSNPLYFGENLYLRGELLESLVIPQNVSEISAYSFINCTSLEEVRIHSGVEQVGGSAFSGCSGLQRVYITDVSAWCGIVFADNLSNPLCCAHNLYVNGVLETQLAIDAPIEAYAFYGCTSIEQVSVSGSTTGIQTGAFAGCTNLSEVVISASVQTVISSAFSGCTALSKLDIDMQIIPSYTFSGTSLQTVVIGNHTETITSSAFSNCTSLEYVTVGAGVQYIGGDAFYKTAIRDVTIPYGAISIQTNAFRDCSSLERVHVLSASAYFYANAFLGCSSITEVHIDNVSDWLGNTFAEQSSNPTSISKTLYLGNQLLSSVIIPQGKTSIPAYAFVNCENLLSVEIPSTVSFIGNYAFSGCTGIQELVSYPITPPTINLYTLQGIPADCPIYVDGSSVNAYKQASYWNERSDYIQEDNRVIPSVLRYATTSSSRSITLYLSVSSGTVLTIDWGDGSSTTVSATGSTSHNYSSTKTYDIYILEQARGQKWSPGCTISSNTYGLFGLGNKNNTYPQLKSVEMGTGMLLSISYGFSGCTGLTSYTVSKYITTIADYVFKGCINISSFTSYAVTPPTIQQHTLSDIPSACPIYVPASSVQNYKSKAYWSARSAYIQAMT